MGIQKHRRRQRGVVLLIILGMLAMFGMLVLAFLLVAGNNKRAAIEDQRIGEQADSPAQQLQQAALQVFRGVRSPVSPLRQHSLLEDMYGGSREGFMARGPEFVDSFQTRNPTGVFSAVNGTIANGQLIAFTPTNRRHIRGTSNPARYEHTRIGNLQLYVGRVLTMMDGVARGQSTRIVGYDSDGVNDWLLILPFEDISTAAFVDDVPSPPPYPPPAPTHQTPNPGRRYIINGTPFAGTGFGYNSAYETNPPNDPDAPANAWLDAAMPNPVIPYDPFLRNDLDPLLTRPPSSFRLQYALLPNRAGDPATADIHIRSSGANEDYDAVDYQNMLLAMVEPGGNVPIPSLHRPALINYWYYRMVYDWLTQPPLSLPPEKAWGAVLQPVRAGPDPPPPVPPPPGPWPPVKYYKFIDAPTRDAIIGIKRRISFRPLVELNDNFSGSNPRWMVWRKQGLALLDGVDKGTVTEPDLLNYWAASPVLNGPWDVDTDGDGVNDSIWVDLGMPVRTAPDGRRYKPLFAILCADMDGRLNINAQGCLAQAFLEDSAGNALYNSLVPAPIPAPPTGFRFADESQQASLPRGQGVGPPEINLSPVLDNNLPQYRSLLMGRDIDPDPNRIRWLDGRYGEASLADADGDGLPDNVDMDGDGSPDDPRRVAPGDSSWLVGNDLRDNFPRHPADDPLSRNKLFEFSALLSYATGVPTAFGTPPDLKGSMAIGLDLRGQPMYWPMVDVAVNSRVPGTGGNPDWWDRFAWPSVNDPYELNLSPNSARAIRTPAAIDHPFSVYELERLLRQYDFDAGELADRLALLAPSLFNHRSEVTSESWHVPSPGVAVMASYSPGGGPPQYQRIGRFTQFLANRGVPPLFWETLAPRELLAGLKMNLNRPLGNGRDDNGNGVVDEPGRVIRDPNAAAGDPDPGFVLEAGSGPTSPINPIPYPPPYPPSEVLNPADVREPLPVVDAAGNGLPVPFDHANGVDVNGDRIFNEADLAMSRQLQARHLFILAMLLRDAGYNVPLTPGTLDATLTTADQRELTVRRIAQWAVNMVDFRDADAIMTPFEYDVQPFIDNDAAQPNPIPGTWDVDGVIDPVPLPPGSDDRAPWRRIVWGCEAPELALGETTAFHDRRLVDSANDPSRKTRNNGNPNDDPDDDDLDSARIPQGSAFFELYCTGNPNNAVAPGSLYTRDPATGIQYLDLGRMAPADAATGLAYPVWRMVISESAAGASSVSDPDGAPVNSVLTRLANRPDSVSLEPEQSATIPGPGPDSDFSLIHGVSRITVPDVQIERIVWFAAQQPTTHDDANRIYYGRYDSNSTPPLLRPGNYAVVGPRPVTVIGSYRKGATVGGNVIDQYGSPSPHMVRLWPQVQIVDNGAGVLPTYPYPNSATEIQPSLGIVVAADPPAGWANTNNTARFGIGISVSEPLPNAYYPEPRANNVGLTNFLSNLAPPPFPGPYETWDAYGDLTETNLDINNDGIPDFYDRPQDVAAGGPLVLDALLATGTTEDYRTVFLQRLADPMQPYDRVRNPYLTVDWSPVDLTVFNSDDYSTTPGFDGLTWDPDDPNPQNPMFAFETRQWGDANKWNPWARELADSLAPDPGPLPVYSLGPTPLIFQPNLVHTLGYLNEQFHDPTVQPPTGTDTQPWLTAAHTTTSGTPLPSIYYGAPAHPFPWLAWNNRPYVNEMEVLQVPASSPARLWHDFRLVPLISPIPDPYTNVTDPAAATKISFLPFGHLPNLLSSDATPGNSPHLYRMLEYLHVPSRFVGTETIFNPTTFSDYTDPNTRRFRPPFNRVSQYREPGRVNLNTIFSLKVWTGVTSGFTDNDGDYWSAMVGSRRGYSGLDPQFPTQFARPFRSFAGSYLVPLPILRTIHGAPPGGEEIQATLLREDTNPTIPETREPLFRHESIDPVENTERNPYFRYQFLQQLAGVTTTRSNVYAVWITLGYFEVEEGPTMLDMGLNPSVPRDVAKYQAVYPDGYALGQELGSDTGEIKRHRAFYLFDRSIPVGFERGRDINVKNAILLERFIE